MEKVIDRSLAERAYRIAEEVARGETDQTYPSDLPAEQFQQLVDYYVPQWQAHLSDRQAQLLKVGDWVAQLDRLTAEDSVAVEDVALYSDTQKVAIHLVGKIVRIEGDQLTVDVIKDGFTTVERSQVLKITAVDGEAYKADHAKHHLEKQGDRFVYSIAGATLNLPKFDHNHLPSPQELEVVEKAAKSEES